MNRYRFILGVIFLLPLVASLAAVPGASPLPVSGNTIIAADWRAEMVAQSKKSPDAAGVIERSDDGAKLITRKQPEFIYSLQASVRNAVALKKGDTLLVRFAARSLKADTSVGATKTRISFGKSAPPWSRSYQGELGMTADWLRCDIPFTCANDFAPGEANLVFNFGYPPQEFEIADLQVLNFSSAVAPASLPKTKRFASKISAETLDRELARIAALHRELAVVTNPAPANGRILNVATSGSAQGDGSSAKPFATIPQALKIVQPGDTILVAAGDYREPRGISIKTSGRPDAWIKLKAAPGARPKLITSSWSGIELAYGVAYIEADGFELEWVPDPGVKGDEGQKIHGVGIAPMYASHHLRILNNVIHGYGTGGICSLDCDYQLVEGNVIYNTAKTSPYGGSAISLCRSFNFDENPGYHNIVRGNICYDNELLVIVQTSSGGNGRTLTDGNGIIIDVFNRSRANPLKQHTLDKHGPIVPYRHRTLVENNLIYDNGGRGIHIFRSSHVDVINNTCYMNQKSADINAGELTAIEVNDVVFLNNLAYGRDHKRVNSEDGSTSVIWSHNLLFNSEDPLYHDGVVVADPLFAAPALSAPPEGFRLRPGSPALGQGLIPPAPSRDLSGNSRPAAGPIDLGAYQMSK